MALCSMSESSCRAGERASSTAVSSPAEHLFTLVLQSDRITRAAVGWSAELGTIGECQTALAPGAGEASRGRQGSRREALAARGL